MQTSLGIAAFYAGLHVLLFVGLGVLVIRKRLEKRIGIGFGNDIEMHRLVRVHGNAAEHIGPVLLILVLLTLVDVNRAVLHLYGLATLAGRVLHAAGLARWENRSVGRMAGMFLTLSSLGFGSLMLIVYAFARG